MRFSVFFLVTTLYVAFGKDEIKVTPWCDNSLRVQITPPSPGQEFDINKKKLDATLQNEGLIKWIFFPQFFFLDSWGGAVVPPFLYNQKFSF